MKKKRPFAAVSLAATFLECMLKGCDVTGDAVIVNTCTSLLPRVCPDLKTCGTHPTKQVFFKNISELSAFVGGCKKSLKKKIYSVYL